MVGETSFNICKSLEYVTESSFSPMPPYLKARDFSLNSRLSPTDSSLGFTAREAAAAAAVAAAAVAAASVAGLPTIAKVIIEVLCPLVRLSRWPTLVHTGPHPNRQEWRRRRRWRLLGNSPLADGRLGPL